MLIWPWRYCHECEWMERPIMKITHPMITPKATRRLFGISRIAANAECTKSNNNFHSISIFICSAQFLWFLLISMSISNTLNRNGFVFIADFDFDAPNETSHWFVYNMKKKYLFKQKLCIDYTVEWFYISFAFYFSAGSIWMSVYVILFAYNAEILTSLTVLMLINMWI